MAHVLALIPARYASTRLPGKPLVEIAGKPMIQHVFERVRLAKSVDRVVVATDDKRIYEYVIESGGEAIMTAAEHASGTDRIAEAARALGGAEIVVNVQGDEPMIEPSIIDQLVAALREHKCDCATPVARIASARELFDTNVVKVAMRRDFTPLYFSRSPIPCARDQQPEDWLDRFTYHKHIGVYAYRAKSLETFVAAEPSPLESIEQLEQLRMLELGMTMICVETDYDGCAVDTPEDVMRVEKMIAERGG
jgi:3-deoxy-manno-octulosonate cytidylyltransferase (CMP-KDO synthetase)